MAREDIIPRLQANLDKIRNAAKSQRDVGNIDTAEHFERAADAAQVMIYDIAAMLIQNPDMTEADVKRYLESYYK